MGYVQGMNFIAATFVLHCNDEDAFWTMAYLLEAVGMTGIYTDMAEIERPFYILN